LPIGERIKKEEGINVLAPGNKKIFTFCFSLLGNSLKKRKLRKAKVRVKGIP